MVDLKEDMIFTDIYENVHSSFRTCSLAYDKGFNLYTPGTLTHYFKDTVDWKAGKIKYDPDIFKGTNGMRKYYNKWNSYYKMVACPTQAILATWLRKEHGIHIDVTLDRDGDAYEYRVSGRKSKIKFLPIIVNSYMKIIPDYEIALEQAIYGALEKLKNKRLKNAEY